MSQSHNPYLLTLPELMSAKKKIGRAACYYDRVKMSMSGFGSKSLNPTEFRSQLRTNFLIELTNAELGAIIMLFDKDGDGNVDTVEFVNEFFRLGQAEQMKMNLKKKEEEVKIQIHKERTAQAKAKQIEKLLKTRTADEFTEEDEKSAIDKVTKVACVYDGANDNGLEEFSLVASLTVVEFKEIMKRNFLITLSPPELCALTAMFGDKNAGTIDTRLFVYHFFRMGRVERDRRHHEQMRATFERAKAHQKRRTAIKDKYGKLVVAKMTKCTEEDKKNVEKQIRTAACYFTKDKAFPVDVERIFESRDLNPTEFKEVLKNNFNIVLTPGELDAVMKMFDTDKDGSISCVEFLTTFFYMGSVEKSKVLDFHRAEQERREFERKERIRKKAEAIEKLTLTNVIWPVLPAPEDDNSASNSPRRNCSKDGWDISLPPINDGNVSPSTSPGKTRMRKPSVCDIIAPDKASVKLLNHGKSLTSLYPKASNDTKNFILEIEEKERLIKEMSKKSTKKKKKKKSGNHSVNNTVLSKSSSMGTGQWTPLESLKEDEENNGVSLDDPNNWGSAGSMLPPDDHYGSHEDRCDSRGGTRSGVTRIPTATGGNRKRIGESGSEEEYGDSEFDSI